MMNEYAVLKEKIMDLVGTSKNQRVRPLDAAQTLTGELGVSASQVNKSVEDLVQEGELVYTYRDPSSYVEIPCNGCDGRGHRAARPMQFVVDDGGNSWLCDADDELEDSLPGNICWDCGTMNFTRTD